METIGEPPKPYTLNPKPYTLHPKPYTLNPKPYHQNHNREPRSRSSRVQEGPQP